MDDTIRRRRRRSAKPTWPVGFEALDAEGALERLEVTLARLSPVRELSPALHLARALRALELSLRERQDVLDDTIDPNRMTTGVLRNLSNVRVDLDDLAGRAEVLTTQVAANRGVVDLIAPIDHLIRDVRASLERETEVMVDAYWVDIGEGD